jgi:hypothetical protein
MILQAIEMVLQQHLKIIIPFRGGFHSCKWIFITSMSLRLSVSRIFTWGYSHRSKGEIKVNLYCQGSVFSHAFEAMEIIRNPQTSRKAHIAHILKD